MEFLAESVGLLEDDVTTVVYRPDGNDGDGINGIDHANDPDQCHEVLARFVSKRKCPSDGSVFTGRVDALTGELLHGIRFDPHTKETYEGGFQGNKCHGTGATLTSRGRKFLGTFREGAMVEGTLVVDNKYSYSGSFQNDKFHGDGMLVTESGIVYKGEFREGRYDGKGELTTESGDVYNGTFKHGRKHGRGTMTCRNGGSYEGEWKQGGKHGIGIERTASGHVYEGEFDANKRHGHGVMSTDTFMVTAKWYNGHPVDGPGGKLHYKGKTVVYDGEIHGCRPHGQGVLKIYGDQDGSTDSLLYSYKGDFCFGLRHGMGRTIYPYREEPTEWKGDVKVNGTTDSVQVAACDPADEGSSGHPTAQLHHRLGTFQTNFNRVDGSSDAGNKDDIKTNSTIGTHDGTVVKNGVGLLTLLDGSVYNGMMRDGIPHGRGSLKETTSGVMFNGEFCNGVKHGAGEEVYADGSVYMGEFASGMRHGDGVLRTSREIDGDVLYKGEWMDDSITGVGVLRKAFHPDPGVYNGQVVDGQRHGHGTFTLKSGLILEGEWFQDRPQDGDWVITRPTGSVYYGTASCSRKNGASTGIPVATGFGTQHEANGDFYSGTFRNGKRHGTGLCVFHTGEQWDGKWKEGVFVKYGRKKP